MVSEKLLERLNEKCGLDSYKLKLKLKLGRWILKEEIGKLVSSKSEEDES